MDTIIKLCGLTRPEEISVANELRPDYAGFVFWPQSRRCVTPEQAKALRAQLDPDVRAVGVFVDPDPDEVLALLEEGIIQVAQLHGQEDDVLLGALRARTTAPLWRAYKVRSETDLRAAEESAADLVLLDNGYGTGQTFDWGLLTGMERPFYLAGGLTPENVAEAVAEYRPAGVDVSSGIETDGVKDPDKMRAFVRAVRELTI